MAAPFSHGARAFPVKDRYQLVRELGADTIPVWAALESLPNARNQLVVVECISRGGPQRGDKEIADWMRDARRLATLEHPNVVRIRDIVIRATDILVVSDFVDGVRWFELTSSPEPPSLELSLRVLVDVLAGLSAVHNLRDANRQPLKLVHGELTPQRVLIGSDGVARVIGIHRIRASAAASPANAYLAPEVLLADDAVDARADVYSVGAMLWEALSGRALFADAQRSAIATQIMSGRVPRATVPPTSPWAAPLADAAARALSADPDKRFASAAAFAAELRRVAGPKLAQPIRVAGPVRALHGDRIRARREALERGDGRRDGARAVGEVSGVERRSDHLSVPIEVEVAFEVDEDMSTAPTPVPPPPTPEPTETMLVRAAPAPVPSPPTPTRTATMPEPTLPMPVPATSTLLASLPTPVRTTPTPTPLPPVVPPVVPTAPPVPRDLVIPISQELTAPPRFQPRRGRNLRSPSPVVAQQPQSSAPPLATTGMALAIGRRTQRRVPAVALIAAPSVLVATALAWWLTTRTPEHTNAAAGSAPPPVRSAVQPQQPSMSPETAAAVPAAPAAVPAMPAMPAGPSRSAAPEPATTATAGAPRQSPPTPFVPVRPARSTGRQKYDPQGI